VSQSLTFNVGYISAYMQLYDVDVYYNSEISFSITSLASGASREIAKSG